MRFTGLFQGVSVVVAVAALVANAYFSYRRMRHDDASRNLTMSALIREWREKDTQKAVAFVRDELARTYPEPSRVGYSRIPDEVHRSSVYRVSHLCDEIAARTILGEADARFVMLFLGTAIARIEEALHPYLIAERAWHASSTAIASDRGYQGNLISFAAKARSIDIPGLVARKHEAFAKRKIV